MIDQKTGEILAPYIRSPYTRVRVQFATVGESKTHQAHAESCDVNNIISRYERTGVLPPARSVPQYADVTGLQGDLTDLHARAQDTIQTADSYVAGVQKKARKAVKEVQQDLPIPEPVPAPSE